jgi:hypothetical protein
MAVSHEREKIWKDAKYPNSIRIPYTFKGGLGCAHVLAAYNGSKSVVDYTS